MKKENWEKILEIMVERVKKLEYDMESLGQDHVLEMTQNKELNREIERLRGLVKELKGDFDDLLRENTKLAKEHKEKRNDRQ